MLGHMLDATEDSPLRVGVPSRDGKPCTTDQRAVSLVSDVTCAIFDQSILPCTLYIQMYLYCRNSTLPSCGRIYGRSARHTAASLA